MTIKGETLIKGLFYFMLKAKGGKYLSRKQVAGKNGETKWVYTYAKKKGEKSKASPEKQVKQSKPKSDKKGMKDKPTTQEHDSDIIQIKTTKRNPPKTDIEKYTSSLWSKSPKYIINKIVGSSKEEGMKILQSLQGRTQKIKEVAKAIPENARVSESDFVEAINSGKEKKLSQVLENIQSHEDIIWTD